MANQRGIDGSFHPNGPGQDVYARHIFATLAPALDINGGAPGWLGFSDTPTTLTTADATSIAVGDVDGDAFDDLVIGANGSPTLVFINSGNDATSGDWNGYDGGTEIATAATKAVALGDVDGDGSLDIFLGNDGADALYLNDGTGAFTAADSALFSDESLDTTAVALVDLNNDHKLDLIVGNTGNELSGSDGSLTHDDDTFTAASGTFTSALVGRTITIGTDLYTIKAAPSATTLKLDRKATADLSGLAWSIAATGEVFLNEGSTGSTWNGFATTPAARFGGAGVHITSLAVGDFDGDGRADVVVGTGAGSTTLLLVNRGGTGTGWLGLRTTFLGGTTDDTTRRRARERHATAPAPT